MKSDDIELTYAASLVEEGALVKRFKRSSINITTTVGELTDIMDLVERQRIELLELKSKVDISAKVLNDLEILSRCISVYEHTGALAMYVSIPVDLSAEIVKDIVEKYRGEQE